MLLLDSEAQPLNSRHADSNREVRLFIAIGRTDDFDCREIFNFISKASAGQSSPDFH
jgi:hypothetical protein